MKKIAVTGGLGFIGSHIVDECVKRGHAVFSIDDLSMGKEENGNPKAPNYRIDISDETALRTAFEKEKPEIVFHCAALARIQPSFRDPKRYFDVNALGTRNVLACARQYGTRRVIYSASSSAYGDQKTYPVVESMTVSAQALHPYGSTKRMGEMLMRDMGRITGGPETVCLRYFNVYGPRQTTTVDGPYATVIGIFLDLYRQKKPLTIVPDGNQRRDFTWVGDIVRANVLASESPNVGGGEVINIGSGENHSIWEVARLVLSVPGTVSSQDLVKQGVCAIAALRQGEVFQTLADISLAKNLLGWSPQMKFSDGIASLRKN